MSSFYIALACLALLQLADWYTTRTILDRGGVELNPVIKQLMKWIGVDLALLLKGLLLVVFGYRYCDDKGVMLMVAIYLVVIINNVRVMRRLAPSAKATKGA